MAEQGKLEGFRAAAARVGTTGAVRRAPLNTAVPKMKDKYDDQVHTNLGYIGPDGVEVSFDEDANEFIPWQELVAIRRDITKSVTAIKFVLWESARTNFSWFLGGEVQVDSDDDSWYVDVDAKPEFPREQYNVDVVDGQKSMRLTLPVGQLTERGSVVFKNDEIIGLEVTITAYPADADTYPSHKDIQGKSARWRFSDSWDAAGNVGAESEDNGSGALSVATVSLPDATQGESYSASLSATGGSSPYTWSKASGGTNDSDFTVGSDGAISGTPTTSGETKLVVKVTDNTSKTVQKTLTFQVNAA